MGFSHIAVSISNAGDGEDVHVLGEASGAANLGLLLDINVTDLPVDHPLVKQHPECFSFAVDATSSFVDPRLPNLIEGRAIARPQQNPEPFLAWWTQQLSELGKLGRKRFLYCGAEYPRRKALARTDPADTPGRSLDRFCSLPTRRKCLAMRS